MRDVRGSLERLGDEGTPRGADAVMRDATASLRRSPRRGRTAPRRDRRAPSALVAVVALVVAIVAGGTLVAVLERDPSDEPTKVAAPSVVVGDADAVVLSSNLDADLARAQIDPAVLDAVRAVDGVTGAQGAMRRFVNVGGADGGLREAADEASERSTIAVQSEGSTFDMVDGRMPEGGDEVAINSVLAARYGIGAGTDIEVGTGATIPLYSPCPEALRERLAADDNARDSNVVYSESDVVAVCPIAEPEPDTSRHVVGVFTLPGGEVDDANLLAMPGDALQSLTSGTGYDRIDVTVRDGEPLEDVLDRIGAALPAGHLVVPASVLGAGDQLRSELEIQRAYHWLVNTDVALRQQASEGRPDTQDPAEANATYEQRRSEAVEVDMRVSRVGFVDADTAIIAYRVYYMGRPSPIANVPLTSLMVRRDGQWLISSQGICQLSVYTDNPCGASVGPEDYVLAPDGWSAPSTAPEAVAALRVMADPASGVDARVAATEDGEALRNQIEAGLAADAPRVGQVGLNVLGARELTPDRVQVLYSLVAEGGPRLETPYPVAATVVRVDGTWRVLRRYACGLTALAGSPCALPAPTVAPTTTSTTLPPAAPSTSTPATTAAPPSTSEPPVTTTTAVPSTLPTTTVP